MAVWGIIFYRIFVSVPEDTSLPSSITSLKKDADMQSYSIQDTFTLALNYRDPFLDKEARPESFTQTSDLTVIQDVKPVVKPLVNWDFYKYGGYIINPLTRKVVSIITIHGREQMVDEGQVTEGVKLIKNYRDSIKVSYQNQVRFITLK